MRIGAPPSKGPTKVICALRKGIAAACNGNTARIARPPRAICMPPKTVRPCSQSGGTVTEKPVPDGSMEARTCENPLGMRRFYPDRDRPPHRRSVCLASATPTSIDRLRLIEPLYDDLHDESFAEGPAQ